MLRAEMDGPSTTALMVAAYRGRATARKEHVCDDPWAASLAGDEGRDVARRYDEAFGPMELWIALRTERYILSFLETINIRVYSTLKLRSFACLTGWVQFGIQRRVQVRVEEYT